jgi:hypothetical protein
MEDLSPYTTAELGLMVVKHEEGRLYFPAKMLREIKTEIANRKRRGN